MFRRSLAIIVGCVALLAGCSSGGGTASGTTADAGSSSAATIAAAKQSGVRLVSVDSAKGLLADDTVTVLDFRTPDEFATGHLDRSTMIDFYEADFRSNLEKLDRNQKYLVYCRSGNRSGQATVIMQELGFTDVADLDGGVLAWEAAGEPLLR